MRTARSGRMSRSRRLPLLGLTMGAMRIDPEVIAKARLTETGDLLAELSMLLECS